MSEAPARSTLAEAILHGQAPAALRAAAARGALPLPRTELVHLFLFLRNDEDAAVRLDAQASLDGITAEQALDAVGDPDCSPETLEFFASRSAKDEALAEKIVFHRSVPASALAAFAGQGNSSVIELVLTNQERLLTHPELIDRLAANPALRADQRARIVELLGRAARASLRSGAGDAPGDDAESPELLEAARLLEVDVGELIAASEIVDGEEFERAEDPRLRNAYRKIITLNTGQKAILAMRGGREERMILIRDTNKIVCLSVLKNPRMTDEDVDGIARMRGVSDEILRQIGNSREWVKSYSVVNALVNNPRTPQGVTMNLVSRLQNQDLKRVLSNHDVPELVRRMARRTLDLRTQQTKTKLKKK